MKDNESGGSYTAVNPTGCGGRGCYGAWQFDPATSDAIAAALGWADLVGVTADQWPPGTQDTAAAWLWDDGRRCSNWAAC